MSVPIRTLVFLGLIAACGHSEPFGSSSFGSDDPFQPTSPVQLTFNPLSDRGPAWLPDGSGILYSAQEGRTDRDVCLALLPRAGGRQLQLDCDLSGYGVDSTNAIESPTAATDGRLAFVQASGRIGGIVPSTSALMVSQTLNPLGAKVIRGIPYTVPGQPTHSSVTQIRWLDADHLVYLAGARSVITVDHGTFFSTDTVISDLAAAMLSASSPGLLTVIPQMDQASGLSVGTAGSEIYYTVGGDTRVFRRDLATGDVTIVHDFGPGAIVRDVHVVGSRLTAVVGGRVHFVNEPSLGPTQFDSGGVVHVVDLSSGTDQSLDRSDLLFRRPALSPTGDRIVVEGYPVIITSINDAVDTTVGRSSDLYLLGGQ
jgi:hypothetical protein